MAIYHLSVKTGSRISGQSAKAKSEYIEREGKYEKNRDELAYSESGNMPEWAEDDPQKYWAATDEHERANGSLFKEVEFALPVELDERQQRELASSFAADLTGGERLPYTMAIHRGGGRQSARPPDDLRARPGRPRPGRGAVVQASQQGGTGEGRGAENPLVHEQGVAGEHPESVGNRRQHGAGSGGPVRADRPSQPRGAAGRSHRAGPGRSR